MAATLDKVQVAQKVGAGRRGIDQITKMNNLKGVSVTKTTTERGPSKDVIENLSKKPSGHELGLKPMQKIKRPGSQERLKPLPPKVMQIKRNVLEPKDASKMKVPEVPDDSNPPAKTSTSVVERRRQMMEKIRMEEEERSNTKVRPRLPTSTSLGPNTTINNRQSPKPKSQAAQSGIQSNSEKESPQDLMKRLMMGDKETSPKPANTIKREPGTTTTNPTKQKTKPAPKAFNIKKEPQLINSPKPASLVVRTDLRNPENVPKLKVKQESLDVLDAVDAMFEEAVVAKDASNSTKQVPAPRVLPNIPSTAPLKPTPNEGLTKEQVGILRKQFEIKDYLSRREMHNLAKQARLTDPQVRNNLM